MFSLSRYFVLSAVWWSAAAAAQLAHLLLAKDSCGLAVLLCASDSPALRMSFGVVVCCNVGYQNGVAEGRHQQQQQAAVGKCLH
jgi:hypothetical protein